MLLCTLITFSFIAFKLFRTGESTLPITTCKRDSVDYSTCIKSYLEEMWPQFITGFPELKFPSLDPVIYKNGTVVFNSGDIHATVILSDASVVGLSKTSFNDVRMHFLDDVFRLEIDVQVPKLILNSDIKMNGTLSIFRVAGNGRFNLTADDVKGTWNLTGHVINDTWIVEHFRTFPSIKKLVLHFDDLFEGKELNDLAAAFVNQFWPSLYRTILPITSNLWDPWLTDIVNNIFSKVSFSKLFP